ncbi:MAG: hypothetical protein GC181_10200 [Bacteroidetes bacterium]|nr:hypothetical protein [Bacteroidota bacterium]
MRSFVIYSIIILLCSNCSCDEKKSDLKINIISLDWEHDSISLEREYHSFIKQIKHEYKDYPRYLVVYDSLQKHIFHSWREIFRNNEWTAYSQCFGEFGGSVVFQENNQKDNIYFYPCICALSVEYYDSTFYIMESSAHLHGSSKISRLPNPKNLKKYSLNDFIENTNNKSPNFQDWNSIGDVVDKRIHIIQWKKEVMTFAFRQKDISYFLLTDSKSTYLKKLDHDTLITLDTLINYPTYDWNDFNIVQFGSKRLIKFESRKDRDSYDFYDKIEGIISYANDTLTIKYMVKEKQKW